MAVEIVSFRKYQKNTLQGFATVRMTNIGLEIRDVCIHEKNGAKWAQMPSKPFKKEDGTQGYSFILNFYDKSKGDQFGKLIIDALKASGDLA